MPIQRQKQTLFLNKLSKYLDIMVQKKPDVYRINDIKSIKKKFDAGQCSGIVALWLYYKHRNKDKYFYDFIINPILAWNEQENTLSEELEEVMEYALSSIRWTHTVSDSLTPKDKVGQTKVLTQTDYDVFLNLIKQDDYPDLRKEYEIGFVFRKDELKKILKDLSANKLIRLGSGAHAIGLYFDDINQEYTLFDPNGFIVSIEEAEQPEYVFEKKFNVNSVEDLIENIQKAFSYDLAANAIGVTISVFDDVDKPMPNYDRKGHVTQILDDRHENSIPMSIDAANPTNKSNALYYAAKEGHLDIVELLINRGAKTDIFSEKAYDALSIAAEKGHYFIVESLLRHEKKQGSININSLNAALARAVLGGHHNIVKFLLNEGADLEKMPLQTFNVLHAAARAGDVFMLETLLNASGGKKWIDKKNIEDGIQKSPLYYAVENDHSAAVELLLHYGAEVHTIYYINKSPLHIAAEYGNVKSLKLLLNSKEGLDLIDVAMFEGETPIYLAVKNGHLDVIQLLLAKGADITKEYKDGSMPIHIAAMQGNQAVIKMLLDSQLGTELVDAKMHDGRTALDLAQGRNHLEVVKLLKSARSEFTDKAKKQVTKNWLDKDYTNLLEIRETYLAVEKKINDFTLEVMELSEYFNGLRESPSLSAMHSKMQRVEVIEKIIKNAQNVVHAKTDNIKVNNSARREKLVTQSEAILAKLSEELLQDIQEVRVSAQRVIEALHSGPFNKKQL